MHKYASIILSGGHSSRMGFPKAFLLFNDDSCFLETIINRYQQKNITTYTVINKELLENSWSSYLQRIIKTTNIVKNTSPEKGRLYSIALGLAELKDVDGVFIHNVDQPDIDVMTIETLINNFQESGIVIPCYNNTGGHPVLIGKEVIEEIKNNYSSYQTLKEVWENFPVARINVNSDKAITNINTPEEFNTWKCKTASSETIENKDLFHLTN